jgi:hypothetical protein
VVAQAVKVHLQGVKAVTALIFLAELVLVAVLAVVATQLILLLAVCMAVAVQVVAMVRLALLMVLLAHKAQLLLSTHLLLEA